MNIFSHSLNLHCRIYCKHKKNNFTASILTIEDIQLEDEGSYSCATRLNHGGVSVSANTTIIVLSNDNDEGMA